jgi:hypothetical protein
MNKTAKIADPIVDCPGLAIDAAVNPADYWENT